MKNQLKSLSGKPVGDLFLNDGSPEWMEFSKDFAVHGDVTVIPINGRHYACFRGDLVSIKEGKVVDVTPPVKSLFDL